MLLRNSERSTAMMSDIPRQTTVNASQISRCSEGRGRPCRTGLSSFQFPGHTRLRAGRRDCRRRNTRRIRRWQPRYSYALFLCRLDTTDLGTVRRRATTIPGLGPGPRLLADQRSWGSGHYYTAQARGCLTPQAGLFFSVNPYPLLASKRVGSTSKALS